MNNRDPYTLRAHGRMIMPHAYDFRNRSAISSPNVIVPLNKKYDKKQKKYKEQYLHISQYCNL